MSSESIQNTLLEPSVEAPSVEAPSVEETSIDVVSTEKPKIIRKSLLQILIELFTGCTSKQTVKSVEELSEVNIEIVVEESKEDSSEINKDNNDSKKE